MRSGSGRSGSLKSSIETPLRGDISAGRVGRKTPQRGLVRRATGKRISKGALFVETCPTRLCPVLPGLRLHRFSPVPCLGTHGPVVFKGLVYVRCFHSLTSGSRWHDVHSHCKRSSVSLPSKSANDRPLHTQAIADGTYSVGGLGQCGHRHRTSWPFPDLQFQ